MKSLRRERGFTMLEVLVATLILVLGIIPVHNLMIVQSGQARFNRNREFAAAMASRILARLRSMPAAGLSEIASDSSKLTEFIDKDPVIHPDLDTRTKDTDPIVEEWEKDQLRVLGRFDTSLELETLDPSATKGPFKAVVEIAWDERVGGGAAKKRRTFVLAQVLGNPWLPTGKL